MKKSAVRGLHAMVATATTVVLLAGCDRRGAITQPLPVTRYGAFDIDPTGSPDRSRIAYYRGRRDSGPTGIFVVDTLGGAPHLLMPLTTLFSTALTWSPDGKRLACDVGGITTIDAETGQARVLATGSAPHDPAWSPDGRWLVYMRGLHAVTDPESTAGMQLIDVESGQLRALLHDETHATYGWEPTWMPDGEHVVFSSREQPGGGELMIVDTHRGPLRQVTHLGGWCMRPQVTSDGSHIYFHFAHSADESVDAYAWESWVVNADGSDARRIPAPLGDHRIQFGWNFELSHPGDEVLFVGLDATGRGGVVRSVNLDGSHPRQLTSP